MSACVVDLVLVLLNGAGTGTGGLVAGEVVDTEADKDAANVRANGVAGVFQVIDNLQVAGASAGK